MVVVGCAAASAGLVVIRAPDVNVNLRLLGRTEHGVRALMLMRQPQTVSDFVHELARVNGVEPVLLANRSYSGVTGRRAADFVEVDRQMLAGRATLAEGNARHLTPRRPHDAERLTRPR